MQNVSVNRVVAGITSLASIEEIFRIFCTIHSYLNQSSATILTDDNPDKVLSKLKNAANEVKGRILYHEQELNKYQMVYQKLEESIQEMGVTGSAEQVESNPLDATNDDTSGTETEDQPDYQYYHLDANGTGHGLTH